MVPTDMTPVWPIKGQRAPGKAFSLPTFPISSPRGLDDRNL